MIYSYLEVGLETVNYLKTLVLVIKANLVAPLMVDHKHLNTDNVNQAKLTFFR